MNTWSGKYCTFRHKEKALGDPESVHPTWIPDLVDTVPFAIKRELLGENITLLLYGVDLRGLGLEPDYLLLLRRQPLLLAAHLHKVYKITFFLSFRR
jgi:hypothetical protein